MSRRSRVSRPFLARVAHVIGHVSTVLAGLDLGARFVTGGGAGCLRDRDWRFTLLWHGFLFVFEGCFFPLRCCLVPCSAVGIYGAFGEDVGTRAGY